MAFIRFGAAIAAALAASIAYATSGGVSPAAPEHADVATSYHVLLEGAETGCEVALDAAPSAAVGLVLEASCRAALPEFAGARFWSQRADGSVAFTDGDGRIAMLFSSGDGVDYESFGPGMPLVSLVSATR